MEKFPKIGKNWFKYFKKTKSLSLMNYEYQKKTTKDL